MMRYSISFLGCLCSLFTFSQTSLPFYENFEDLADSVYTESTDAIEGAADLFSYVHGSYGSFVVENGRGIDNTRGVEVSAFESDPVTSEVGLILTLDLSSYDILTEDILLSIHANISNCGSSLPEGGYEPCGPNELYVRGSSEDSWVYFLDVNEVYEFGSGFVQFRNLSLRDSLDENGQQFSDSTQIRFYGEHLILDNIEVFERKDSDIELVSLSIPKSQLGLTGSEQLTAHIENIGELTQNSIPITASVEGPNGQELVSETINTTLNTSETLDYTFNHGFDFSSTGEYAINIYTQLSEDENLNNDTLSSFTMHRNGYTGSLPFFEDFDNSQDSIYTGDSHLIEGTEGFSYESSDPRAFLEVSNSQYNDTKHLSLALIEDINSLYSLRNDAILSIDMSEYMVDENEILLDVSYRFSRSSSYGIFVRGNVSSDWVLLYDWQNNPGNAVDYVDIYELPVSDTLKANGQEFSESFEVLFSGLNRFISSYVDFDNVKVYERKEVDLRLLSTESFDPSAKFPRDLVSISAYNFGQQDVSNIPLSIHYSGSSVDTLVSYMVETTIPAGDSIVFELDNELMFDMAEFYTVEVFHSLASDLDRSNDTLQIETYKRDVGEYTVPIEIDFEDLELDTVYISVDPSIEGLPGFSFETDTNEGGYEITSNANNGVGAIKLRADRNDDQESSYTNSELYLTIDMHSYDVSNEDLILSFAFTTSSLEEELVYIRESENDDWIILYDLSTHPDDSDWKHVDYLSLSGALSDNSQNYSSTTQIRFIAKGLKYFDGSISVDDIRIYPRPDVDIQIIAIETPPDSPDFSTTEDITIGVINRGLETVTSLPLTLEVAGPIDTITVDQTFSTDLVFGDTLDYTFSGLDLSEDGYFAIKAHSSLSGDENPLYDTLETGIKNLPVYSGTLPFTESFENIPDDIRYSDADFIIDGVVGFAVNGNARDDERSSLGEQSLAIYGDYGVHSDVIFTMDLASYKAIEDNLSIEFDFTVSSGTLNEGASIYARGTENDDWLELFYYGDKVTSSFEWKSSGPISVSAILDANGQDFSEYTQFQFNNPHRYTTLYIDNLKIYQPIDSLETGRSQAVAFTANDTGYWGLGADDTQKFKDFYRLNSTNNSFEQIADFPGVERSGAVSFVIDDIAYVGLGEDANDNLLDDFYSYDPGTNVWLAIADFGGGVRSDAIAFSVEGLGYVGTGLNETDEQNDFWKYDPILNSWSQVMDLAADKRRGAFAFASGGKGYVGGGFYFDEFQFQLSDIQEYDPQTDTWTERIFADGINLSVNDATAFSLYGYGFIAYGNKDDVVKYNPKTNEVENLGDVLGLGDTRKDPVSFVIGDSAVFGMGSYSSFPTLYSNVFEVYFEENKLPENLAISYDSINENSSVNTVVGEFSVEDTDELSGHSFRLAAGDGVNDIDNSSFTVSGNELIANDSFNFEQKSTYQILVEAEDSRGGSTTNPFEVIVKDMNDSPTALLFTPQSIFESTGTDEELIWSGVFSTEDEDQDESFTYTIVPGDGTNDVDNDRFSISAGNELYINTPNFEEKSNYLVNVQVEDKGGEIVSSPFVVEVQDANDPPSDISLSGNQILEDAEIGSIVGSFSTTDEDEPDQSTFTYSIKEDLSGLFAISGQDLVTNAIADRIIEDAEYEIEITSSDEGGLSIDKEFTVLVLNVLGTEQFGDLDMYPNPVTDFLQLKLGNQTPDRIEISINTLEGKVLMIKEYPVYQSSILINVSTLPSGTYLLNISDGENSAIRKILKE